MQHQLPLRRVGVRLPEPASPAEDHQPAPEPLAGHHPRKESFHDCLHRATQIHEQALEALRLENILLLQQLSTTGDTCNEPPPHPSGVPPTMRPELHAVPLPRDSIGSCISELSTTPRCINNGVAFQTSDRNSQTNVLLPGALAEPRDGRGSSTPVSLPSINGQTRFPLAQQWVKAPNARSTSRSTIVKQQPGQKSPAMMMCKERSSGYSSEPREGSGVKWWLSYPGSPGRLAWDLVGGILILFDLFAIPLEAFDPPRSDFLDVMDWFTLLFWTVNMPIALQVGFVRNGVTIMDFRLIVIHYLRTWFIIDLIVVLPDWILMMASMGKEDSQDGGSAVKLLRTLRLFRMVRMLRMLKLKSIMRSLQELIESEYISILTNIMKMIVLLLVINHYISCIWYMIGNSHTGDDTWIIQHNFHNSDWGYKYLTAFHWAITQFTPSSMHVQPQNSVERAFAILVVVFALVCFSYVVGSITGSLTQLRTMQDETYRQFWIVRRYLKHNRVPQTLCTRIERYLENAWASQRQTLHLKQSKLFSLLSEQLQSELQYEIALPFLRVHPLFSDLSTVSEATMRRVAYAATQRKLLAQGDHLFFPGEIATHMYILVSGRMQYSMTNNASQTQLPAETHILDRAEDFISEPVLWTPQWVHLGDLTSLIDTEVVVVDPKKFKDIIHKNSPALIMAIDYGKKYLNRLNAMDEAELSDILPELKRPSRRPTTMWDKVLSSGTSPWVGPDRWVRPDA
uniref:Cyclic nucleotide-binding domain-containing protein n=1 Tax=Alexandrium monilatum TaxID=311494 RepID=A0A7S4UBR6_9DINO|mmetsp:Transcript_71937/g.227356  ORF Transcript_71937/g.227356 Transcript_71937/m.227356 type:complete len:739 (-) Transcript_71937:38-2254(-)